MPTLRRALLPRACLICGQEWTPQTSKQAREKQTCSPACSGKASGLHRIGKKRPQKSDPLGRVCTRCGVWKNWGAFAWKTKGQERSCWCRVCARAYNRAYRAPYQESINAAHRRATAQGRRTAGPRRRMALKWRKTFERHDRQIEKTRRCAQLVGAYFRDYASWCAPAERPTLYLHARLCLAWLLRGHAWMSVEQITAVLHTSAPTVDWYVASVRRAIRDRRPQGGAGRPWSKEQAMALKAQAQELLRRAEGHAPGSLEPLAQPQEHAEHAAPSALEVYWRKRAAQREREQRYG